MRESKLGYEGSGLRADNDRPETLAMLEAQMEALRERAENHEDVTEEVNQLKKRIDMLNADKGRIESAGMM